MADGERVFTEHGALIRRTEDGTVRLRTADGLKMVFAPNPTPAPPEDPE